MCDKNRTGKKRHKTYALFQTEGLLMLAPPGDPWYLLRESLGRLPDSYELAGSRSLWSALSEREEV